MWFASYKTWRRTLPVCLVMLALSPAGPRLARAEAAGSDEAPLAGAAESVFVTESPPVGLGERRADAAVIATTPAASGEDLLRLVPGLLVARHGAEGKGRQLFLRGFDAVHGADVEVTVDGVPWNEPSNVHGQGYLDLGTLIPEAVVGLTAHKGSFRLGQGAFATAGSVGFELGVAPERRGLRAGYELGSTNRHRAILTAAPRAGSSFVVAEALRDAGFGQNRETERLALLGRAALVERGGHELALFGGGHLARFGEPGTLPEELVARGRVGFYDSLSPDTDGVSGRAFAAASWRRQGGAGGPRALVWVHTRRLRLAENFTGHLVDAVRGDRVAQVHHATGGGLRLGYQRPLGARARLELGADARLERVAQHEDRVDAAGVAHERSRELAGLLGGLGLRAGGVVDPWPFLRAEGGVRLEGFFFDVTDLRAAEPAFELPVALLPRLAVTAFPAASVSAVVAYGRGVRPPEARAVPGTLAGVDARPALSHDAELGLRWQTDALEVGFGGFAIWLGEERLFDHLSATTVARAATRRMGVELDLAHRPRPWLHLRADVTAVAARFSGDGAPVPGAPRLVASVDAHLVHPSGWSAGLRGFALGPRPLAYGARAGASGVIDALVRFARGRWDASLTVDNVLGTRVREGEFNYASWFDRSEARSELPRLHFAAGPPRTVRLGLAVAHH